MEENGSGEGREGRECKNKLSNWRGSGEASYVLEAQRGQAMWSSKSWQVTGRRHSIMGNGDGSEK